MMKYIADFREWITQGTQEMNGSVTSVAIGESNYLTQLTRVTLSTLDGSVDSTYECTIFIRRWFIGSIIRYRTEACQLESCKSNEQSDQLE